MGCSDYENKISKKVEEIDAEGKISLPAKPDEPLAIVAIGSSAEGLEALERQHYDIIFMDVKMPMMNGIQASMEIKKLWPKNGPKIIAVTAYALAGDKEKCLAAGMDGYIPKPVQIDDLAKALEKYMPEAP